MYKVFIDNSVIEFLDSSEERPSKAYDLVVNSLEYDLTKLLDQVDFEHATTCLLVVYEDFELAFNQVFNHFEMMDASGE